MGLSSATNFMPSHRCVSLASALLKLHVKADAPTKYPGSITPNNDLPIVIGFTSIKVTEGEVQKKYRQYFHHTTLKPKPDQNDKPRPKPDHNNMHNQETYSPPVLHFPPTFDVLPKSPRHIIHFPSLNHPSIHSFIRQRLNNQDWKPRNLPPALHSRHRSDGVARPGRRGGRYRRRNGR